MAQSLSASIIVGAIEPWAPAENRTSACLSCKFRWAPACTYVLPAACTLSRLRRQVESVACMFVPKPHHVCQVPLEGGAHVRAHCRGPGIRPVRESY